MTPEHKTQLAEKLRDYITDLYSNAPASVKARFRHILKHDVGFTDDELAEYGFTNEED